jgi:clan AA aspartic protease (TIGR02281 family)
MPMRHLVLIAGLLLVPPSAARGAPELRTWTSSDGKNVVRAELVEVDGDVVRLRRPDGVTIPVPLAKLCPADREFLAVQAAKKKKEAAAPDSSAEKVARAALEQLGVRVSNSGLVLSDEFKLARLLRDATELQKNLAATEAGLIQHERNAAEAETKLSTLLALNISLNAQLANVRPGDATTNNRLIGSINANQGQIELLRQSLRQHAEVMKTARSAANETREAYIQAILNTRTLADSLSAQYAKLLASDAARSAVQQWNAASGKALELGQSRTFQRNLTRLKALEDTVLSEEIPLQRVGGGSLIVSVVIDGKHPLEMVLDSGANLLTLPRDVAEKCGILVRPEERPIGMTLADGSRIRGNLVKLGSVRVGKFTAENVECAVLGVDSSSAPLLLGMSFLEHFKFQVDAAKGTLSMVQIRPAGGNEKE